MGEALGEGDLLRKEERLLDLRLLVVVSEGVAEAAFLLLSVPFLFPLGVSTLIVSFLPRGEVTLVIGSPLERRLERPEAEPEASAVELLAALFEAEPPADEDLLLLRVGTSSEPILMTFQADFLCNLWTSKLKQSQ